MKLDEVNSPAFRTPEQGGELFDATLDAGEKAAELRRIVTGDLEWRAQPFDCVDKSCSAGASVS